MEAKKERRKFLEADVMQKVPELGHELASGAGRCLLDCGMLSHKLWCAEGDEPTAANLNLCRGWKSRVVWHSVDEPLFGERGDAKLIVSVSFSIWALCRWKGKSCLDSEANTCCLGHGDILVMDGQCQDEFLSCTDPGLEQERINVTFRWIRQHAASCPFADRSSMLFANVCAGLNCCCNGAFWAFWLLLGALCILGGTSSPGFLPLMCTARVTQVCLSLDTPSGRGSVEALSS